MRPRVYDGLEMRVNWRGLTSENPSRPLLRRSEPGREADLHSRQRLRYRAALLRRLRVLLADGRLRRREVRGVAPPQHRGGARHRHALQPLRIAFERVGLADRQRAAGMLDEVPRVLRELAHV